MRSIEKSFDFCQGGESHPKNDKHKLFESKITELGGALELALPNSAETTLSDSSRKVSQEPSG